MPPVVVNAQVWLPPGADATATTPLVRPLTSTGVSRSVVVPSPSCPRLLLPQHLTPPALVSAQLYPPPAVTAATPLVRPVTSTGVSRSIVVPSPIPPPLSVPK